MREGPPPGAWRPRVRARDFTLAAAAATIILAALPAGASAKPKAAQDDVVVCNEAENSHRGGYTVTGGPVDPNPPAFLRGSQMRVGAGAHAAERSPALRLCGPTAVDPVDPVDQIDPVEPVDPPFPGDGDDGGFSSV
jgi:hypothetical protein